MPKALSILFGSLFTVACCYTLGRLLLEQVRARLYREEERLLALVSGASLLHLLVFALAAAQVMRKGVLLAAGLAILLAGWRRGIFRPSKAPALPPSGKFWKWLFAAVYAAYAFLYWSNAMAPEISPDGSSYHLGLVARYLREQGFSRITTNMYANLTQGIEMLYLFAFAFGRHSAASMVHFVFTMTLPLLMMTHARRSGFPAAGAGGALLLLCSPVVGVDGTSAYNDVAVATVVFATFCLLHIWAEERQQGLLIPIGLLAGYCFATKYTAALAIPYAGLFVLWKTWRRRQPLLRPLLTLSICAATMMLPWMAKNWIIVGNPLSPFMNRVFPNPNVRISFEREYIERMRHYGDPKSYWEVPLDLTVHGEKLAGMLGPVYVLAPLSLLALRRPEGRRLLLAGLLFALPYFNNIGTRFLVPALPFFSLALGMACERSRGVLPSLALIHAIICWPPVLRLYCSPHAWKLERVPMAAALRLTPEEKYLTMRHYGYVVARMVEDHVPAGEKVFTYSGTADAYTNREILVAYQSGENSKLGESVWTALFPDSAPTRRLRFGFDGRPLRRLRLVETKGDGPDQWSITEWRILSGKRELPRSPEWRLRAWPNPWDVQLAFDNSPVTRWKSWQSIFPGMFMEVDLGSERKMDAVLLETTKDQYGTRLKLYGQREKGDWMELSDQPQESETPPRKGLRRVAMEEMRAHGVRYFLVASQDPPAQDFLANGLLWGIHLMAERGGTRLYAIEAPPE
ncbi:MAG: glycosyltransferase family 39 protein [Acidobacteria bacterium]|nr:glycosyltransferase family 39 protein [Acidobacteriota bacterium]